MVAWSDAPDQMHKMIKYVYRATVLAAVALSSLTSGGCYKPVSNTTEGEPDQPAADLTETRASSSNDMNNTPDTPDTADDASSMVPLPTTGGFRANVDANLKRHGSTLNSVIDESSPVQQRILTEYGAVLLSTATPPIKMMFTSEQEVEAFQAKAGSGTATMGGAKVVLQPSALEALQKAAEQARAAGLSITPRDGEEAARRSYSKTLELWNSRFLKACDHWIQKGRLTKNEADKLKALPIGPQVAEVLELEKKGIFFNTFFNNSILFSVAAPGTSQHLSMLAFDATEFQNPTVRKILAQNGWFRTVQNDEPHFTFLGRKESDLKELGLKQVTKTGGEYWVPDI
jgi:hypothetical protein